MYSKTDSSFLCRIMVRSMRPHLMDPDKEVLVELLLKIDPTIDGVRWQ